MPAVSKKQQRFFGYLLSNPEERKKRGISKKAAKDFAQDVQEVAPPGWGHTKAEKEKTKPDKPKSKIGGTAAAFKRALDDGRFKGLPGDKTYKDKKASMFKLMWAMKKKGDKPHYKPGTDKKYKKYQEEDWKPEIEVVDTKKRKKEAEKKRKEAASSLPPHLRLDAMKKAFAHTNEEVEIEEKYKSYKQDVLNRDKAAKRGLKTGKAGSAKARRRRRSKPGGTEKLSDVNKSAERKSMQSVGGFRGAHGASRKSKSAQGRAARIEYRRKSPAAAPKKHDTESVKKIGTFVGLQKRIKESASIRKIRGKRNASLVATGDHKRDEHGHIVASHYNKTKTEYLVASPKKGKKKKNKTIKAQHLANKKKKKESREVAARTASVKEGMTPMQDNNLFGNAYAGSYEKLKKKIGSKKKHNKPAIQEGDFQSFMADAQAARDRVKKKIEDRKKKDAQFVDTKKHGVRFYDKKGKGRIRSGKKIYDK